MLILALKVLPNNNGYNYLQHPDLHNNRWFVLNKSTIAAILCDKKVELTEELRNYILYFGYQAGGKLSQYTKQFASLPIKEELC